jgi:hypothetical protein
MDVEDQKKKDEREQSVGGVSGQRRIANWRVLLKVIAKNDCHFGDGAGPEGKTRKNRNVKILRSVQSARQGFLLK